jgi:N-acetylglutamate synthase-like GNAT family acetyltransferase
MQWFLERGFEERGVEALPESRRDIYNWERKSKIYMKDITTARDLGKKYIYIYI